MTAPVAEGDVLERAVRRPYRSDAAAVLVLIVVMATGLWTLFTGTARPTWDAASYYAPAVGLVGDFARSGRLLTWDPWVGGGRPACADPQSGAASPLVVLTALVGGSPLGGFLLFWCGGWLLGGIGVLVLGRCLGSPPWGRLCAAAAFISCGYFTGHGQHTTIVVAFATLPWFVWCLDRALAGRSLAAAFQAGAIWGLAGLSGYPALVIIHGLYGTGWAIGRVLLRGSTGDHGTGRREGPGGRRERLLWPALVGPVAVATALVVLSPTYVSYFTEGRGMTSRTQPLSRYWAVERGALLPGSLKTFASPEINALGVEHPGVLYSSEHSMVGVYLSPLVLVLAIMALFPLGERPRDSRWRWWLLALGAGCLAAAFGDLLPVRGWLYELVPPTRYFRFPALFRGYALFSAVVLALEAGRDLGRRPPRRAWIALASLSAVLGAVALWTAADAAERVGEPMPLAGWGGWTALAWLGPAAVALTAAFGGGALRRAPVGLLVALALADAAVALRLSEPLLASRHPKTVAQWRQLDELHRLQVSPLPWGTERHPQSPWGLEDNRNQFTKQAAFGAYDPFRNRYHRAWLRSPELTAFVTGSNRFWFAPRALAFGKVTPPAGSGEPSLLRVATEDFRRFARRAIAVGGLLPVIHPVPGRPVRGPLFDRASIEELPPMERLPVQVLQVTPELLGLRIEAPAAGWLLVTDRYAPGWRATVDGVSVPVQEAAFLFRAIAVEAGRHDVYFEFRPAAYRPLVAASWSLLTLALLAAPALTARRRRLAMLDP